MAKLIYSALVSAWIVVWNSPNSGGGGGVGLNTFLNIATSGILITALNWTRELTAVVTQV